jgi:hypothetical protein
MRRMIEPHKSIPVTIADIIIVHLKNASSGSAGCNPKIPITPKEIQNKPDKNKRIRAIVAVWGRSIGYDLFLSITFNISGL